MKERQVRMGRGRSLKASFEMGENMGPNMGVFFHQRQEALCVCAPQPVISIAKGVPGQHMAHFDISRSGARVLDRGAASCVAACIPNVLIVRLSG